MSRGILTAMQPLVVWVALALLSSALACSEPPAQPRQPVRTRPSELVPEAPGVEACADARLVAAADLAGLAVGDRIAVDGKPAAELRCTLLACGSGRCCNKCRGGYDLHLGGTQVRLLGAGSCRGPECDLDCQPFGSMPRHAYRFVGTVRTAVHGQPPSLDLSVERFCRVDATVSRAR